MAAKSKRSGLMQSVHRLGAQIGLDHAKLSQYCCDSYPVDSMSKMTEKQLADLQHWLKGKAALAKPKKHKWTPQDKNIFRLGYALKMNNDDLRKFFLKQTGGKKKELKDLDVIEKNKVINGLSAILKNNKDNI